MAPLQKETSWGFFQKINLSMDQMISHVNAHMLHTMCMQAKLHLSVWGPQGLLGAMLGSSTTEGGTGPSPGDLSKSLDAVLNVVWYITATAQL